MMYSLSLVLFAISSVYAQTPSPRPTPKVTPKATSPDVGSLLLPLMAKGIPFGPAPKGCSDYEVLVARGTGEPGPFGVVVGDLLIEAITKAVPGSRGYAVQYPASLNITVSTPTGVDDTILRLNGQHAQCPKQKFALVGYSQGASVMHGVFGPTGPTYPGGPKERPKLNQAVIPSILALVMFGDPGLKGSAGLQILAGGPKFPPPLYDKLRENCAPKDPVCDPVGTAFENHLEYAKGSWQKDSADFIIAAFRGQPLPKAPRSLEDLGMAPKGKAAPVPVASAKIPRMLI